MCPLGFFLKVWMIVFFLGRKSGKYIKDCSSCQGCQSCDMSSVFVVSCLKLYKKKSKVTSMLNKSIKFATCIKDNCSREKCAELRV